VLQAAADESAKNKKYYWQRGTVKEGYGNRLKKAKC